MMKKLGALVFLLSTSVLAQPITECQLLQQRVITRSSDASLCLALYQRCAERTADATNVHAAKNQCSAGLGECQMGGALDGEFLQQAIAHYKKLCEKSTN